MAEGQRWWRFYCTTTGASPVREFIRTLDPDVQEAVAFTMKETARAGRSVARHLTGDIYARRISVRGRAYRVLFSAEGRRRHVLLALSSFEKKSQKTPDRARTSSHE